MWQVVKLSEFCELTYDLWKIGNIRVERAVKPIAIRLHRGLHRTVEAVSRLGAQKEKNGKENVAPELLPGRSLDLVNLERDTVKVVLLLMTLVNRRQTDFNARKEMSKTAAKTLALQERNVLMSICICKRIDISVLGNRKIRSLMDSIAYFHS